MGEAARTVMNPRFNYPIMPLGKKSIEMTEFFSWKGNRKEMKGLEKEFIKYKKRPIPWS